LAMTTPLAFGQTPPTTPPATPPATAPAPATAATSEFFPLKVGASWVYRIDDQRTLELKVEKMENGEATIAATSQGKSVVKETVKVTTDGIYRVKINDVAIVPPIKVLALPVKKGDSWEVNSKLQEKPIQGKLTVVDDKAKIKLKDGKEYECVYVEGLDFKIDGTSTKVRRWYAAGKGEVKLTYDVGGQEATLELVEYKEGK
jgi:hypothetical protein